MTTNTEFARPLAVSSAPVGFPAFGEATPSLIPQLSALGSDTDTVLAVVVFAVPNAGYQEWLAKLIEHGPIAVSPPPPGPAAPNRPDIEPTGSLAAGRLRMDLDQMRVSVSERAVEFTHQEFLLLKVFMQNPGRVLSRRRLLELAWEYGDWGTGRTVDVHVRRLRAKLETEARWIVTVRGFGYRFDPPPAERSAAAKTA